AFRPCLSLAETRSADESRGCDRFAPQKVDRDSDPCPDRQKPGDRIDNIVPEVETSPGAQQEPEYANVQDQRDEDISPVDRVAENGGEQQRQQIAAVSEDVGVVVQEADGG